MSDELDDVRALLPDEELRVVDTLESGDRSTVLRVRATSSGGARRSLVVKRYHEGDGRRREPAALRSVPGAVRVPAIIAAGENLLVLEDLGAGGSVADALLGSDPADAAAAVVGWAEAVAELHCATRGSREAFAAELTGHGDGAGGIAESWLPDHVREAERLLDRHCGSLGVTIPSGALTEFTGLLERLGPDAAPCALSPADTCPDNNVRIGDRVVLIDFEGAHWAHIAWDVAYLVVPVADVLVLVAHTGRCALSRPAALSSDRGRRVSGVADDAFLGDVEAAAVGWCMLSSAFSLDFSLGPEPELDHQVELTRPSPQRRALILNRLNHVAGSTELPALTELAAGLLEALRRRWHDAPLELAPAFRDRA